MTGKGKQVHIPVLYGYASATNGENLTLWVKPSFLARKSKQHKSGEICHGENRIKAVMGSNVWLKPRASEKGFSKDSIQPYQEPRKVPLAEKAKAYQGNQPKGIRQISPVSSV